MEKFKDFINEGKKNKAIKSMDPYGEENWNDDEPLKEVTIVLKKYQADL